MQLADRREGVKARAGVLVLLLVVLIGLGPAAHAEHGQQTAVGPYCAWAFEAAVQAREPAAVPDPDVTDDPSSMDASRFDETIKHCISPEEWATAAAAYEDAFEGADPMTLFVSRCTDPEAGLSAYLACHAYLSSVPAGPTDEPQTAASSAADATLPPAEYVPLPQPMKAYVRGATKERWFEVRGNSVDALLDATVKKSRRVCRGDDTLACVIQRWGYGVSKSIDPRTGTCTVARAETIRRSVVYLPRWAGPAEVHPDVLTWWRGFLRRAAWHESMHIEILQERLVELEDELEGRPCRQVRGIVRRWEKDLRQAQRDFDLSEQERGLPLRPEYWMRP